MEKSDDIKRLTAALTDQRASVRVSALVHVTERKCSVPLDLIHVMLQRSRSKSVPSKIHNIQLVTIQHEKRLSTPSELNPASSLATGCGKVWGWDTGLQRK